MPETEDNPQTPAAAEEEDAEQEGEDSSEHCVSAVVALLNIGGGGLLQATVISIAAALVGMFFSLLAPFFSSQKFGSGLITQCAMLASFAGFSLYAGRMFPDYAFLRSGLAFITATACDTAQVVYLQNHGLFVPEPDAEFPLTLLILILPGSLVCALAGSAGSRLQYGLGKFVRAEFQEFYESIGLAPRVAEPDEPEPDDIETKREE